MFPKQRFNRPLLCRKHTKNTSSTIENLKLLSMGLFMQLFYVILVLFLITDFGVCEYENTWNFYYEQPCCGNSNGHHLRHHRGKYNIVQQKRKK